MADDHNYTMDTDYIGSEVEKSGSGSYYFDCSICLDKPIKPVLTCCGHLFCLACFSKVPYKKIDSSSSSSSSSSTISFSISCPVCRGDVPDSAVIPIYGNAYRKRELVRDTKSVPTLSAIVENLRIMWNCFGEISHVTRERMRPLVSQDSKTAEAHHIYEYDRSLQILSANVVHLENLSAYLLITEEDLVEQMDKPFEPMFKKTADYFDCSICLDKPMKPILTWCGHLFCWACFYHVPPYNIEEDSSSTNTRCPVCRGEVPNSAVIPIYGGNGEDEQRVCNTKAAHKVAVESRGLSTIVQGMRRTRSSIDRICHVTTENVNKLKSKRCQIEKASGKSKYYDRSLKLLTYHYLFLAALPIYLSTTVEKLVEQLDAIEAP